MEKFTFIKTDQFFRPSLAPTLLTLKEEQFDLELANKRGEKINGFFTKDGSEVWAFKPQANSGYGEDTVIVRITTYEEEHSVVKALCPSANGETYLFKREHWDRVYAVGIAAQPLERPRRETYASKGGVWGE